MILKIAVILAIVVSLVCWVGYSELQKFRKEITTPVISLIDEEQISALLQRFYSTIETEQTVSELKQERMSIFMLKGSVSSVRQDLYLHKRKSEWVVFTKNKSSFSFTRDGFVGVSDDDGVSDLATLLRDGSPFQILNEKTERRVDDLLLVVHKGNILIFDFNAKSYHYRPIDN